MEKKLHASVVSRRVSPPAECWPYLYLFATCYGWFPSMIQFEKKKKRYLADPGGYVLLRLPADGTVLEQDAFTMQTLTYLCDTMSELRRPKYG